MLFRLLKPALFALDSETGHRLAIRGLKALPLRGPMPVPRSLGIAVAGLTFPNPVGVAAGFDKDAEVPDALLGLGFGFTEVGSITPPPAGGQSAAAPVPAGRRSSRHQPHGVQQCRGRSGARASARARRATGAKWRDRRGQYRRQQGLR